jgi:phenylalanyl-tRNA synthetase beta chain
VKVPLSWLQSFVDVSDLGFDELLDVLSLNGLEVEEVKRPGAGTTGVRTKQVVAWGPHPDADRLRVVQVTDGDVQTELVCGARNFDIGDVVAHAEVGATIPGDDGPFRLEARKLRGVLSNGMLCSAKELQLGEDHDGIMLLDPTTPLGTDLLEVLPVGEAVIDVAVLADRGDHHSILGIAREVGAILDRPVTMPDVAALPDPSDAGVPVTIAATDGCSWFTTRVVEGVAAGRTSPWWLRQRLAQCGVRSIDLVVDVTNYVMLELGQPLHAFDLDRLAGPELTVRWARDGETITTLDDRERTLTAADLVIDDAQQSVSLAGVMGGATSEVGPDTTRVLLEGAVWAPQTIRDTAARLGLPSEASLRFARRVDPAGAARAVERATQLLVELGGATAGATSVAGSAEGGTGAVTVPVREAERLLGIAISADEQAAVLRRGGADVAVEGDTLVVTPPSWRGDVLRPADVVEEVARLHGYEAIPATLPAVRTRGGRPGHVRAAAEAAAVVRAHGLHEVRTRPLAALDGLRGVVPDGDLLVLANPLAKDAPALAPSLVEGLLGAVRGNTGRGRPGTALFELQRIFRPSGTALDASLDALAEGWQWTDRDGTPLPTQPRVLGLALQGRRTGPGWLGDETWGVLDALAVLDDVVHALVGDDPDWTLERTPAERDGLHPGRTAVLRQRGVEVGVVGQLHPDEAERRDLPEPVVVAELLVEPLLRAAADRAPSRAPGLARHQSMAIDVAVIAPDDVDYATVAAAVTQAAGDLLDDLRLFDVYRGEQVAEGSRSMAMALRLQAADRQLSDEDAATVIAAVDAAVEAVGATLRR